MRRREREGADGDLLSRGQLGDGAEAASLQQPPCAAGHHEPLRADSAERRQVEVVVVHVRDEYGVHLAFDPRGAAATDERAQSVDAAADR